MMKIIVDAIINSLREGMKTKSEICRATGITYPTVIKYLRMMVQNGTVEEVVIGRKKMFRLK